ncbi:DUF488 domain-containing protein [Halopseudomonas bauzanensis]|uniref:DUF488 domain-containing protein n=1 Tax=Halopseudomonas bauzanensis TaxID=653930 RepID=A0A1I4P6B2_9GAMM|nr:DUF488 domain-containing protein [Halopseudomonas bauzanensis]SES27154.1 Protein of unknown function, DUF488 [Halopseudomonas bauzanensis]SFM22923.1 Protein of unknown function, DUF488 [Halopseudomonas bauzanensis]
MAQAETIWTIGHSTRSIEEFIALLHHYRIEAIADVRRFPGSRRLPQFGQEALRASLNEAGIDYQLITELGGRRRAAADSVNVAWRNASFRGYADHTASREFAIGLERLQQLAVRRRTSMMCAEVLWWRCHRSLVSDVLMVGGTRVMHIQDEQHCDEHPYTSPARLYQGRLTYDATRGEPLNARERSQGIQQQLEF